MLVLALMAFTATSALALPTSSFDGEKDFEGGVVTTNPLPPNWASLEPESGHRPRLALGLEETPVAFQNFYRDVMRNYRRLAPQVHDLPEFAPGVTRPDLLPNDPRRQVMESAIRTAFGRAVEQMAITYADEALLKGTPLHNWLPRVQQPTDPTLPDNVVPAYSFGHGDEPQVADAPKKRARTRYLFGVSRFESAMVGVDTGAFQLQAGLSRVSGLERIWAIAPLRGEGLEGNVGVSTRGEVFVNAWIRF